MTTVSIEEIKKDFLNWFKKVEAGEKVIILKSNKPLAEIIPLQFNNTELRPIGLCKGDFIVPDDFDSPLPEKVIKQFEGR